jgi:hypothetical protein
MTGYDSMSLYRFDDKPVRLLIDAFTGTDCDNFDALFLHDAIYDPEPADTIASQLGQFLGQGLSCVRVSRDHLKSSFELPLDVRMEIAENCGGMTGYQQLIELPFHIQAQSNSSSSV